MSGRDIDGGYRSCPEQLAVAMSRREQLRAAGRCIDGPLEDRPGARHGIVHGPVVQGGRCQRCWDKAKETR